MSATTILFMALSLFSIAAVIHKRSHYMIVDRLIPDINKEWIAENLTLHIRRINANEKQTDIFMTILKDVTEDLMCEIKVFQKMGGKYMKAPADLPKTSCCKIIESNTNVWPCIRKFSNLPEKCPITKGTYEIKKGNPEECDDILQLPPNMPENYRVDFQVLEDSLCIVRWDIYVTLKKKFSAL